MAATNGVEIDATGSILLPFVHFCTKYISFFYIYYGVSFSGGLCLIFYFFFCITYGFVFIALFKLLG